MNLPPQYAWNDDGQLGAFFPAPLLCNPFVALVKLEAFITHACYAWPVNRQKPDTYMNIAWLQKLSSQLFSLLWVKFTHGRACNYASWQWQVLYKIIEIVKKKKCFTWQILLLWGEVTFSFFLRLQWWVTFFLWITWSESQQVQCLARLCVLGLNHIIIHLNHIMVESVVTCKLWWTVRCFGMVCPSSIS